MATDGQTERLAPGALGFAGGLDPLQQLWRVATWEYDRTADRLYWFDSPVEILNLTEESGQILVDPIVLAVRSGAPWEHFDLERRLDDRHGAAIDVRVQARLLRSPEGVVAGCVGVVTDVSEQRRSERVLRGAIDRYRRLVELNPDCVVVHQDGVIRYVNPAGVNLVMANDSTELVGRPIVEFVDPSSVQPTLERIVALTEIGMVSEPAELDLIRTDGSRVTVESTSVLIDWEGRSAYQVILRDVSERRRTEAAVRYQASLLAQVSDAVISTDVEGRVRSWNPAAEALYGWPAEKVVGELMSTVVGPLGVAHDGRPLSGEVEHQTARGPIRVSVSVAPVRDELGSEAGSVAVCADLTALIEREAAEERFRAVVAALDEGVIVIDHDLRIVSVNASARELLGDWLVEGMGIDAVLRRWPLIDEDGGPLDPYDHPIIETIRSGQPRSHAVVGLIDGSTRWFSVSVQWLDDHQPRAGALVCSFSEITQRRHAEELLSFQATHDPLTGLPNRDVLLSRVAEALTESRRDGMLVTVQLLDLDRFKAVNDSLGHVVGDSVLVEIAERLEAVVAPGNLLGRLAGDEFMVISTSVSAEEALAMAGRLAAAVATPVRLESGRNLVITASVGVACADGSVSPDDLLARADVAMYRAKDRGRARVEPYDRELASKVSRDLRIQEGLRRAVGAGQIDTHYQPIVSLRTGRVVGCEALARWEHTEMGTVRPSEFVAIAEDVGLMVPLGAQVLRSACEAVARWRDEGACDSDMAISVNLSPRQLLDPGLMDTVVDAVYDAGLTGNQLWLEVTESVLMEEADQVSSTLADLRRFGVHLAIDDFGTGYSSLAYLRQIPVEALKIDRSFLEGLGRDAESNAIVEAIIRLAQSLHLRTIAEGVETEAQLERLRELGCDFAQGYLLARPAPAKEVVFDLGFGV